MNPFLKEIRHNPLLWLLAFVPVVFAAQKIEPEAHTLLFVLSVLAIVPLAALLSHATESVAAKTGDAAGGLLNATLGNLTELVIAWVDRDGRNVSNGLDQFEKCDVIRGGEQRSEQGPIPGGQRVVK
jgi:hypothetical protein